MGIMFVVVKEIVSTLAWSPIIYEEVESEALTKVSGSAYSFGPSVIESASTAPFQINISKFEVDRVDFEFLKSVI